MTVELLGTMRVLVDGVPLPKMRSRKAKWLLALFALRAGKPIGRSAIAGTLWPDTDPTVALTNLRSVVSDLRQALGSQAVRLQSPDRRTLAFDFQDVEIDVRAFDSAIQTQDWEAAIAHYVGPLLQDCEEEWAGPERSIREQACLKAYHLLAESADPLRAVELCQRAVELSPGNDAPRRDLMTAYVRSNDLNAALAAYREFAQALRTESGGIPDLQTTDLYVRLRSGRPPFVHSEPMIRASLPHPFSSFVGREDERVELLQTIRSHRLVTLVGTGGIGKTRLAREVASDLRPEYSDGAGFLALEAVPDEAALIQSVVTGLRIKPRPNTTPLEGLIDTLRTKRLLLVLDNCEHLVPACARLAECILAECPTVRILATSREPLGLIGEKVWPLPGLTTPDPHHLPKHPATLIRVLMGYESVEMLIARAQTATRDFELNRDNAVAVAELCATLEGSPLAIELAAGRLRTMGVAEILARLQKHRLDFLGGHPHVGVRRHHSLRATLDWSYSLLTEKEQRLLARLSVFADGWTMEAAEAITEATPTLLESLVEKSLVTFSADGRYGFLETVRQYAAERLAATDELPRLKARHIAYYADLCESLAAARSPHEAFHREMGNFNAVMDCAEGDPEKVLGLTKALHWYWMETYALDEGTRRVEDALARFDSEPSSMRAQGFRNLAILRSQVDHAQAVPLHEESLRIWREVGDQSGMVRALSALGLARMFAGCTDDAKVLIEESIAIAREALSIPTVPGMLAYALNALALVCVQTGDYRYAEALAAESLDLMAKHARPLDTATVLRTQSFIAHDLDDHDRYRRLSEQALSIYRSSGNEDGAAWCLVDLGNAATELGQVALGRDLLEESQATMRRLGDRYGTTWVMESLGVNAVERGDIDRGLLLLRESIAEYREQGYRFGIARALDALGDALRRTGVPDVEIPYRESLRIWVAIGARKRIRDEFLRIGEGMADLDRAIRLWAFAYRLGETMGAPIPFSLRKRHEQALRFARSEGTFQTNWSAGWELSLEQAVDLALLL